MLPPGSTPKSKIPLEEIRRLYFSECWTLQQIGDHFNVSRQYIHQRLKRAGDELHKRYPEKIAIDKERIQQLYIREELTMKQAAARLGVGTLTLARIMNGHKFQGGVETHINSQLCKR